MSASIDACTIHKFFVRDNDKENLLVTQLAINIDKGDKDLMTLRLLSGIMVRWKNFQRGA